MSNTKVLSSIKEVKNTNTIRLWRKGRQIMGRVLFAVDSFFQLIEATNLRITVYKDDDADVAIYASTPNAKEITSRLNKSGLFTNCYFLNTSLVRCGSKYSAVEKAPKYFAYIGTLINPVSYTLKTLEISDLKYDKFLFSGYGALPECIFNAIRKINTNIECFRFEDSYVSYTREYGKEKGGFRIKFEHIMHNLFHGANIEEYIKGYYFAEPGLVQVEFSYPILESPRINRQDKRLINLLNDVFGYNKVVDLYGEKFIFFESGDSYFQKNDEDVGFITELIRFVGKDNVLVKRHPRCVENRFERLGVHIAKNSSVPWELIQLNKTMDGKVFITTTSAAALSSAVYFGDDCKSILLYEGMKEKPASVTAVMRSYMKDFQKKYGDKTLYIPKDMNEFKKIIEEEV